MNIFVTSNNPTSCASVLDDKRVVKMILESAQLLSTSINKLGGKATYKSTHINHPCTIWARENKENYKWLLEHFISLLAEYSYRFEKQHKCSSLMSEFYDNINLIPDGVLTKFPNCTIFKDESNIHLAYKKYLVYKWTNKDKKPKWTKVKPPEWSNYVF